MRASLLAAACLASASTAAATAAAAPAAAFRPTALFGDHMVLQVPAGL